MNSETASADIKSQVGTERIGTKRDAREKEASKCKVIPAGLWDSEYDRRN